MFQSKHKVWRHLLLARAVLLSLALVGHTFPLHQRNNQGPDRRVKQRRGQSSERFLNETGQGRIVLTYLRCTDFDCVESLERLVKIGPDIVPPLINLLQQPVPRMIAPDLPSDKLTLLVWMRLISALGELKDERSVGVLVEALKNKSREIRARSAEALGKIGGDLALANLIPLLRDDEQFVRETVANSLGRLKRREALAGLYQAAKLESTPHVRQAMQAAIKSIEGR